MLFLIGHTLELVLAAALLAAHAYLAVVAAQRHPLVAGILEARLLRARHAPRGEDISAGGPVVQEEINMNPTSVSSKFSKFSDPGRARCKAVKKCKAHYAASALLFFAQYI